MKKIGVFLNANPYYGGVFQYSQSILDALASFDRNRYEIIAIYTKLEWKHILKAYSFQQIWIEHSYFGYAEQIDALGCDVVICPSHDFLSGLIRTKIIGAVHDLMHRYERQFPEVSADGAYEDRERFLRDLAENAAGVLADSEYGRDQLIQLLGEIHAEKIFSLPYAPPKYLENQKDDGRDASLIGREALPEKFILYPAQFWRHKNHRNLILAMKLLKDRGVWINAVFVGSKKDGYEEIYSLIEASKLEEQIKIFGYVTDAEMALLYKKARAMVMPSFFGPTNIPPLEGFSTGCPVAVSDVYGMREQVGDAALLFDPNSIEEIADIMSSLWNDDALCGSLSKRGTERIKLYRQEKFNERLQWIVERVLQMIDRDEAKLRDIMEFASRYRRLICYGVGEYSFVLYHALKKMGFHLDMFVVSDGREPDNPAYYLGRPVRAISSAPYLKDECGVFIALRPQYHAESIHNAKREGFSHFFVVDGSIVHDLFIRLSSFCRENIP